MNTQRSTRQIDPWSTGRSLTSESVQIFGSGTDHVTSACVRMLGATLHPTEKHATSHGEVGVAAGLQLADGP